MLFSKTRESLTLLRYTCSSVKSIECKQPLTETSLHNVGRSDQRGNKADNIAFPEPAATKLCSTAAAALMQVAPQRFFIDALCPLISIATSCVDHSHQCLALFCTSLSQQAFQLESSCSCSCSCSMVYQTLIVFMRQLVQPKCKGIPSSIANELQSQHCGALSRLHHTTHMNVRLGRAPVQLTSSAANNYCCLQSHRTQAVMSESWAQSKPHPIFPNRCQFRTRVLWGFAYCSELALLS
jgi:hypothetical protein